MYIINCQKGESFKYDNEMSFKHEMQIKHGLQYVSPVLNQCYFTHHVHFDTSHNFGRTTTVEKGYETKFRENYLVEETQTAMYVIELFRPYLRR